MPTVGWNKWRHSWKSRLSYSYWWQMLSLTTGTVECWKTNWLLTPSKTVINDGKIVPVYPYKPTQCVPLGIKAINGLSLTRLTRLTGEVTMSLALINCENMQLLDRYFKPHMECLFREKKHLGDQREHDDFVASQTGSYRNEKFRLAT